MVGVAAGLNEIVQHGHDGAAFGVDESAPKSEKGCA